jgi:hypothetical protein
VDVSAAATGSLALDTPVPQDRPGPLPASQNGAPAAGDGVSSLLQLLSLPQIHNLVRGFDEHRSAQEGVAETHLQGAGAAVADHDLPRAFGHLSEYVRLSPGHAPALLAAPSLIPIQGGIQELLRHATRDAGIGAEGLMATARLVIDSAVDHPLALYGPDVLAAAERFAESGQLLNYIRASELSQSVITAYSPVRMHPRESLFRRGLAGVLGALWDKVPVLVLLSVWFALGAAAGITALMIRVSGVPLLSPAAMQEGFELWGIGFLALVGVQFCVSIRRTRE